MKLIEAQSKLYQELLPLYGEGEAREMSRRVMGKITGLTVVQQTLQKDQELSGIMEEKVGDYLMQLLSRRPLQYVLEEAWFYDLRLYVDERVLIPRPETEELADWMIRDLRSTEGVRVLDIGTGSGCLALALKSRLPSSEIIAADISSDALEVVKKNALKLELDIHYFQMDVLNSVQDFPFPLVDVIVSNPPYIPQSEKSTMEPHVLNFEPHLALFSPDEDPLLFYRFIGYFAKKYLKKGGSLYLELHAPLAEKNIELMQEMGFGKIELKKDMQGLDRMMKLVSLI